MDSPKNQITDKLKQATNVLVTVSNSPSVDQLAAAIGLTLLLNKLGKHATAVFSGQIPSTLEFLQPEKTLEKNTDSLRDFIIALDKSKADKLRYKVEDQMVKIFITPYRTSISDKDLEFSQGDFNVEVVMALGVIEQKDLDQAITSHGRILHDATVIGVNTQPGANLGGINWVEPGVSSLSEMMLDLGLELQADALDAQMATAFLTGIVAETDRFSNEKTSSLTMQLSAKLMAAGANQQLIASQLQPPKAAAPKRSSSKKSSDKEEDAELPEVAEGNEEESGTGSAQAGTDGSLHIDHGGPKPFADEEATAENEETEEERLEQIHIDTDGTLKTEDEIGTAKQNVLEPLPEQPAAADSAAARFLSQPPSLGGTLTANSNPEGLDPSTDPMGLSTSQAQPQTPLLSHDAPAAAQPPLGAPFQPAPQPTVDDILGATPSPLQPPSPDPSTPATVATEPPAFSPEPPTGTLSDLEKVVGSPHLDQPSEQPEQPPADQPQASEASVDDLNAARDAVMQAVNSTTPQIVEPVQSLNAAPMDLNLGDMPAVSTSPASAFTGDNTMVNPSLASPAPVPDPSVTSDPGLPPGLVPPDPGLPTDNTDTVIVNPSSPPPVPPPLIPPAMPPTEDSNTPGNAAL